MSLWRRIFIFSLPLACFHSGFALPDRGHIDAPFLWGQLNDDDPNTADPRANITCIGDLPPFDHIAPPPGTRDEDRSLQKLCAQARFGGYPRPYNAEMQCAPIPSKGASVPTMISFKNGHDADGNPRWFLMTRIGTIDDFLPRDIEPSVRPHNRLLAYCFMRCACSGVPETRRQPLIYEFKVFGTTIDLSIRAHQEPAARNSGRVITMDHFGMMLRLLSITIWGNRLRIAPTSFWSRGYVGIKRQNHIKCPERLPRITLPPPARPEMYGTSTHPSNSVAQSLGRPYEFPLTRLCAVASSYGHETLNAGGYCDISRTNSSRGSVWFADEMTPNLAWTFTPPSALKVPLSTRRQVLILREYCAHHCSCKDANVETMPPTRNLFAWLMVDIGRMTLPGPDALDALNRADDRPAGSSHSISISSPPQAAGPTSTSTTPPLVDILGLDGECTIPCTSSRDCLPRRAPGNQLNDALCRLESICVVSRPQSQRGNAVVPEQRLRQPGEALRRVMTFTRARCASVARRFGRLGSRDVEGHEQVYCACNSSYVSAGCCDSADGIVWEDLEMMMGTLEL